MKNGLLKNLMLGLIVAGAMSVSVARADVVVTIDPSPTWNGFMNVFELPSNGGGFVLPLPASLTMETRTPVAAADVEPWLATIIRLADDQDFYAAASARARAAASAYQPEILGRRYADYFTGILNT